MVSKGRKETQVLLVRQAQREAKEFRVSPVSMGRMVNRGRKVT
jgi:hypothetical protein